MTWNKNLTCIIQFKKNQKHCCTTNTVNKIVGNAEQTHLSAEHHLITHWNDLSYLVHHVQTKLGTKSTKSSTWPRVGDLKIWRVRGKQCETRAYAEKNEENSAPALVKPFRSTRCHFPDNRGLPSLSKKKTIMEAAPWTLLPNKKKTDCDWNSVERKAVQVFHAKKEIKLFENVPSLMCHRTDSFTIVLCS